MASVYVGTSGYQFKEWKGTFYPDDLPERKMLSYYSERLKTVEINYTFYHMPTEKNLSSWAAQTGTDFLFALKGPQRITHRHRLADCAADLEYFFDAARTLQQKLGPVLFQLPPFLRKDVPRLAAFCRELPGDVRVTIEFRHESWLDAEVFAVLASHHVALTINDTFVQDAAAELPAATFLYARLRQDQYTEADLERWAAFVRRHRQAGRDAFLYFKHELKGPELAARLAGLL